MVIKQSKLHLMLFVNFTEFRYLLQEKSTSCTDLLGARLFKGTAAVVSAQSAGFLLQSADLLFPMTLQILILANHANNYNLQ